MTANIPGRLPWTAVLQEERRVLDGALVDGALDWANQVGPLVELRNDPSDDGREAAARREWRAASAGVAETPADRRRFAVFSQGRIPLAVQLGYVPGDRDRASWSWEDGATTSGAADWTLRDGDGGRVSLSGPVLPETVLRCGVEIDIRVPEPSVRRLRAPSQLRELARRRAHLYNAGPAAGAVAFGRGYNPRMNPKLVVYEHRRGASQAYEPALVINR